MRTRLCTALFTLLLVPALIGTANAQTLTADQVVDKYFAAVGGREAISKITSRKATGTIVVETPMGNLTGTLEMIAKSPNKMRASMRIDLTSLGGPGEMAMDQVFDGTNGWISNSMQGEQTMAGAQLDSAKNAYFPSPLLGYKEHGMTIALEPSQKLGDRDAYVILLTPKTGAPSKLFFDKTTFLLVRTVSRSQNPQTGEDVESVSDSDDYREVNGLKVAHTMYQSAGGQTVTMKFAKIEDNVPVDDSVFIKK